MTVHPKSVNGPTGMGPATNESNVMQNDTPRAQISKFLSLLIEPGSVFEIRAPKCRVGPGKEFRGTASGFFTDDQIEEAAERLAVLDAENLAAGWYLTLNPVNKGLLALAAGRMERQAAATTADADIDRRTRLLIDIDPVRKAGTSATDDEVTATLSAAREVACYLTGLAWPEPLATMSGNGAALIFAVDLPVDDQGLVERVLKALAGRFDTDRVKIDTSVHNPARITKIIGTTARKGDEVQGIPGVADRVHRRARLVSYPPSLDPVSREALEAVAGPVQVETDAPLRLVRPPEERGARFDVFEHTPDGVTGYLQKHDVEVIRRASKGGSVWLHLARCPVVPECEATSGSDIAVVVGTDGRLGYKNFHNRGDGLGWTDLRDALEPGYKAFKAAQEAKGAARPADGPATTFLEGGQSDSRSELLVKLAVEHFRLGVTGKGEPFAVRKNGPNVAMMLGGTSTKIRDILCREYRRQYGGVVSANAVADAVATIRGEAVEQVPEPVHLRVASYGDGVVLDLGTPDGAAVVITKTGWQVVPRSPVLFQRTGLTGALPIPVRGGDMNKLREVLNVAEESFPLLVGWLVAAFMPDIPHPILMLGGLQGTGKTTAARFITGLFDPSDAPTRSQPRDPEAWAMMAANSWSTALDNVSTIPDWLSDALCKAVTGDGWVRRTLYTNGDVSVLNFRRVIVLTSIDPGALRGDLAERLLLVDLELIPPSRRRSERQLNSAYTRAQPLVLGALLDLLAKVLAGLDAAPQTNLHRMADFAQVLHALDAAIGTDTVPRFSGQGERIAADVLESDAVGSAIREFIVAKGEWAGNSSALLERITPEHAGRDWPKNGRALTGRLKRLVPALALKGVEVRAPDPTDKTRTYHLRATAQTAQPPESAAGGSASGGSDRAVGQSKTANRPTESAPGGTGEAGFGRSGGSGGPLHIPPSDDLDEGWGRFS